MSRRYVPLDFEDPDVGEASDRLANELFEKIEACGVTYTDLSPDARRKVRWHADALIEKQARAAFDQAGEDVGAELMAEENG